MNPPSPNSQESFLISPEPGEKVLSTLEADGSRRWLKPKLSCGKWHERRRVLAYVLIVIFTALPFVSINGKPSILLDIAARRFTIFGFTFLPTDTVLLAIFLLGLLLSVFLLTALFGRIWCGWACPQTVYMEFLFRPIERLFDGTTGRGGSKKNIPAWRTAAKYVVYFLLCIYLANTFLAYFVGVDRLFQWVQQSPLEHPVPFMVMASVTLAMMVDFCFFREQMCTIACPYGRFQSVMLDPNSLIVAYDPTRGEPRGKIRKTRDESLPVVGDCIDCGKCVTTCPTGIDIREGLQMECINCTQCIDACNAVMGKIGRPQNLIRYSSQARDRGGQTSLLRARTAIYPLLILGIATAFFYVFLSSKTFDAAMLREPGNPFVMTEDGRVRNMLRLRLTNRTDETMVFRSATFSPQEVELERQEQFFSVEPQDTRTFHISLIVPISQFSNGRANLELKITNQRDVSRTLTSKLIGPYQ